ncbi:longitudinals lacking protein, isoforms H/M/V isoform X2 [Coccinella septempunctata]|uniref:longitudinals lacking protein, isoforms H/M/V isoform X2 n=1 Tax=Coccinella septempunctata TaxID=41139 RepID=UPI001D08F918|nr:longitudinals lacking protein, isoforms H/M/V isoform X2 [Coccinella septempunctata]
MTMQQYCLRWNNHQPNFISVFSSLLNSESLVDVTLAAEGRHLQAHKVVLSACSSYFQSLFTINPCQHPIVILKDVKFVDLKIMVDFMYYGEVNVSQEQLPHILKTAEMLKIKGLAEIPVDQSISRQDNTSDRAELLTTVDTSWNNEPIQNQSSPSPCPSSPSCRRKRLRKSSTGSGSGSLEKSVEESHLGDSAHTNISVETVIKSDPSYNMDNITSQKKQSSSDSELQRGSSHESSEGSLKQHIHLPISQQEYTTIQTITDTNIEVPKPSTSTSHPSDCRLNWTNLVDQTAYNTTDQYNSFPTNAAIPNNVAISECALNIKRCTSPATEEIPSYQRKKRSVNPQSEERFIKALEAVRFGGIGFCKAAKMYGVNNRTLWLEYKKRGYPNFRLSIKNRKTEIQNETVNTNGNNVDNGNVDKLCTKENEHIEQQNYKLEQVSDNPVNMAGPVVGYFDNKHIDFTQMIQRMNPSNIIGQPTANIEAYPTVNFDQIN